MSKEVVRSFLVELFRGVLELLGEGKQEKPTPDPEPQPDPEPDPEPPIPDQGSLHGVISVRLLELHNQLRSARSLEPLQLNGRLSAVAQAHAVWMAANRKLSHEGDGGSTPFERIVASGYRYRLAGENIASGYATPAGVFNGWVSSPGHLQNMLGGYSDVGFGVASSNNTYYWCAVYGVPSNEHTQFANTVIAPEPLELEL